MFLLQISLDIVQCSLQSQLQFVDFEAESTNQQSSPPLEHVIRITGVKEKLFFTIQSTKKPGSYIFLLLLLGMFFAIFFSFRS